MNSEEKLNQLLQAMRALVKLPVMELAENKQLVQQVKSIVSSKFLTSILDDIKQERFFEKQAAFNTKPQQDGLSMESDEFLKMYARYQSAAFNAIAEKTKATKIRYTVPVSTRDVRAFNALRNPNPMLSREVQSLPETRQFAKAFNSIYSDHALQIGTAQDPTRMSSYIDYSPYIYNYRYYLSIPTLAQTIDLSNAMATRKMPKLIFENPELSKRMEKQLKILRFNDKVRKMLLYSALSPRGALIVPIEERGQIRFNVFNDTQFTYATSYQYSKIDFRDNATGVSQVFCLGNMLQNEVTAHFLCPGFEPIFAIGKNKLYQLKDAAEAVNIYLYTIKVLCVRAQVLVQKWGGAGQNDTKLAAMQRMTQEINSKLSLNTAVDLPEDATLDILNNNLSPGFAEVAPIVKEYQGMLSGLMGEYYYGSATASYAGNNFNIRISNQNIHSQIQEAQIAPIYRFCVNTLLRQDADFKQFRKEFDNFDIEFESLYEPTESEKAETDAKKIANLIEMRNYPEMQEIFKKEGLLRDELNLPELPENEEPRPTDPIET